MTEKKPPLCKCGCGELTKWSKKKPIWNEFIKGHARRGKTKTPKEKETQDQVPPLCACGCKKPTKWSKNKKKWNKFIVGHDGRRIPGKRNSGKNNLNWKGGISQKNKNKRTSPVHQRAKELNISFEEAAQRFRELYDGGFAGLKQTITKKES